MDIDWQEVKRYMQEAAIACDIRGMTLATSVAGQQRFFHVDGTGSVSEYPESRKFGIGCVSRTLIAVLALRLQEKGLLDIDDSVSKYMTELADDERFDAITLRHLLQHTAGYGGFGYGEDEDAHTDIGPWLPRVRYAPQIFDPGAVMDFEGSNSILASEILRRVGGRAIGLQLEECVSSLIANTTAVATLPLQHSEVSLAYGRREGAHGGDDILDQIMQLRVGIGELLAIGEVICGDSTAPIFQPELAALHRNAIRIPRAVSKGAPLHLPTGYGLEQASLPTTCWDTTAVPMKVACLFVFAQGAR